MSLQYVIDGYNIIHHPIFIQHAPKKIKDSRASLLEFIRINRLCGSPKNKVTVVFDGHADSQSQGLDDPRINVIFSRNQTADERINKIIETALNPKNLAVVSDDKEIRLFARAYRAKSLSVEEFINLRKSPPGRKEDLAEPELSYAQMHKINQELRKIWL